MGPGLLSVRPMATVRAPAASNHLIGSAHRRPSADFLQSQQPMTFYDSVAAEWGFRPVPGLLGKCILGNLSKKKKKNRHQSPLFVSCTVRIVSAGCGRAMSEVKEFSASRKLLLEVESLCSPSCRPDEEEEEEEETSGRIPSPSV